jgi:hypothetical protein
VIELIVQIAVKSLQAFRFVSRRRAIQCHGDAVRVSMPAPATRTTDRVA